MKRQIPLLLVVSLVLSCGPRATNTEVTDATLDAKNLACIFTSRLLDPSAVARACGIADAVIPILIPIVRDLIGQREAARSAGVSWPIAGPVDGGAEAGTR